MKKYIYNANQFSQLRQLDICTSDLGILSDPGSAKNPTVPSCQQKYARHFGSFSQMWKLKKNACNQTTTLVCSMKHQKYCWKKNTFKLHQGGSNSIRLLLAAGLPGIQQNMPASTVGTLRLESLLPAGSNCRGSFFVFHCKIIRREFKIFDPNSCKKREAGLHSLSESPLHEWIWTQTNRIPCCTSR